MSKIKITIIIFIIIGIFSCNEDKKKENNSRKTTDTSKIENTNSTIKNILNIEISKPKKDNFIIGDDIEIIVSLENYSENDSIKISINDKQINTLTNKSTKYIWNTKNTKVGKNKITASIEKEGQFHKQTVFVILLSDIIPKNYTFKIKNVYKHDVKAYTQGLFYKNGFLYEATGLKGESTVRKVKLETGEVLQSFAIPTDIFGEGIDFHKGKIIQISWEAGRGFVYDFNTFELIDEFSYSGQGWGIASDGKNLFMTNGSSSIYKLEDQSYTVIDEIEVYDNKKSLRYLNELEYIDGYLYANIYQYEKIAKIEPSTGKIVAYIDLSHILPMNDYKYATDVLNGIAYDKENKRFFVTGKKWPKLFEIELIEKK